MTMTNNETEQQQPSKRRFIAGLILIVMGVAIVTLNFGYNHEMLPFANAGDELAVEQAEDGPDAVVGERVAAPE